MSSFYITVSIITLAVISLLVFFVTRNRENRLTPLAGLAFGFVLAGILFGEERFIGYALMGVGVILAVVDIVKRARRA